MLAGSKLLIAPNLAGSAQFGSGLKRGCPWRNACCGSSPHLGKAHQGLPSTLRFASSRCVRAPLCRKENRQRCWRKEHKLEELSIAISWLTGWRWQTYKHDQLVSPLALGSLRSPSPSLKFSATAGRPGCARAESAVSDPIGEESAPLVTRIVPVQVSSPAAASVFGVGEVDEKMALFATGPPSRMEIVDGKLMVEGTPILTGVPDNVTLTANDTLWGTTGAFLGASFDQLSSRHVFSLGVLQNLRFLCCFRFKLWWMAQGMGSNGRDVPVETQFLLVESPAVESTALGNGSASSLTSLSDMDRLGVAARYSAHGLDENGGRVYTVFLPLLEGAFRACLHGNEKDELEVCLESGDVAVETQSVAAAVYAYYGTNPFDVITEAVRAVEAHSQSFLRRERKKMPGMLDYFGWCTWDAFYTDVTAEGVCEGLSCLAKGGAPARFVIIDDGWQTTGHDQDNADVAVPKELLAAKQYVSRLTGMTSNKKFKRSMERNDANEGTSKNFGHFIRSVKDQFDLKYVYVWHALTGYWGGVSPNAVGMDQYVPSLKYPIHSPGVLTNQPDMAADMLTLNGLGLVHPEKAFDFFNELHSYLAASGIDGVKVDVQNILETLGAGFGGRVEITKMYHKALEESISINFPDNGCIACMSHNTDGLYSAKQTAVVRASDDFWPTDPAAHTVHICAVAYNSLFLGEFMQPDWDMFHSLHPASEFHAAARAIGGCAVYVSDKPGKHDFSVLKKLVLPDGRILRARLPGRPTRDCLFSDPARDGTSLLKIWNLNMVGGVVGAFNCQGSAWCKTGMKYVIHDPAPNTVSGSIRASDVDSLTLLADPGWNGDAVAYSHHGGKLIFLRRGESIPVSLRVLECEIFTIAPVKVIGRDIQFAPIGLADMYNAGGAILFMRLSSEESRCGERFAAAAAATSDGSGEESDLSVTMAVRGCRRFIAYSSQRPSSCTIDTIPTELSFAPEECRLSLELREPSDGHVWTVKISY